MHPVLTSLVTSGNITSQEKQQVIDHIASADYLNEQTIAEAANKTSNPSLVADKLSKGILQQNTTPRRAPSPTMPVSQEAPQVEEKATTVKNILQTALNVLGE